MVLQNYKVDGDNIIISRQELEKWRDLYDAEAMKKGKGKIGWFYLGKREVLVDILKMCELLMG